MGYEVFLDAVLTIGTTYTTLLNSCMEALDSLEMFAVNVGLAKLQFTTSLNGNVQILSED